MWYFKKVSAKYFVTTICVSVTKVTKALTTFIQGRTFVSKFMHESYVTGNRLQIFWYLFSNFVNKEMVMLLIWTYYVEVFSYYIWIFFIAVSMPSYSIIAWRWITDTCIETAVFWKYFEALAIPSINNFRENHARIHNLQAVGLKLDFWTVHFPMKQCVDEKEN